MDSSCRRDILGLSDGGEVSSNPVSAGHVSSSAREDFITSVNGGRAYQALEIEGMESDNEASTVRVSMTHACEPIVATSPVFIFDVGLETRSALGPREQSPLYSPSLSWKSNQPTLINRLM